LITQSATGPFSANGVISEAIYAGLVADGVVAAN
jgi:hypothetical protein